MDYADKVSAFMSDFDEDKNSFYQAQSQVVQQGSLKEKQGEDMEGIGVGLGAIGYKIAGKLGINDVADEAIGKLSSNIGQAVKQGVSNAYKSAKSYVSGAAEPDPWNPSGGSEGNIQDIIQGGADDGGVLGLGGGGGAGAGAGAGADAAAGTGAGAAGGAEASIFSGVAADGAGLATVGAIVGEAIPVVGTIAAIIAGIVEIVKGHHEEKNNNAAFTMPAANIDLPRFNPGL
mgnify:CR=1 FL=1|tara:strand:- start:629 stop:1324 length:696 start_codon:yes stop_codon:yes gene_type:complete